MDAVARGRLAGIVLVVAAALEVFTMAHHPTITTPNIVDAIQQITSARQLDGLVHGALMALLLIVLYGLSEFMLRRDICRPAIRAGLIAYSCGVLVMLGAGMVSGFILPGVLGLTSHASATDLNIDLQLILLCRAMNQSCANFATVVLSAGITFWSYDLLRRETGWRRALGISGLVVGVIPAAALIMGLFRLDVRGMTAVLLLQSLWTGGIGVGLLRDPKHAWARPDWPIQGAIA
jgi:hypothetical protein